MPQPHRISMSTGAHQRRGPSRRTRRLAVHAVATLACVLTGALAATRAHAQQMPVVGASASAADSAGIARAARDYIEGWYTADGARMASALHPELVKRIMTVDPDGRRFIQTMGASQLVRGTSAGGGRTTPAAQQRTDVRILDIFRNAASVRVDAGGWVDYLQLVRWQERWVILNVLWELRGP